jgi:hypothetical protein
VSGDQPGRSTNRRRKAPSRVQDLSSCLTKNPNLLSPAQERQNALSRWDNEGGAGPQGSQKGSTFVDLSEVPPLTNAELVQLRVRVIALENLMIMLLAEGPNRQLDLGREMAPRPGFTHHPLTIQAAGHMVDLVDRAIHYRSVTSS